MIALLAARLMGTKIAGAVFSRTGGIIAAVFAAMLALHMAAVHYRSEGRAQVRVQWQAANAKAAAQAATLAAQRDAAVRRAETAETAQTALVAATATSARASIIKGFADAPATRVDCLSPSILQRVRDADAALAASRATIGRADPVRRAAPRVRR